MQFIGVFGNFYVLMTYPLGIDLLRIQGVSNSSFIVFSTKIQSSSYSMIFIHPSCQMISSTSQPNNKCGASGIAP